MKVIVNPRSEAAKIVIRAQRARYEKQKAAQTRPASALKQHSSKSTIKSRDSSQNLNSRPTTAVLRDSAAKLSKKISESRL